jgi:hypothetical protein
MWTLAKDSFFTFFIETTAAIADANPTDLYTPIKLNLIAVPIYKLLS